MRISPVFTGMIGSFGLNCINPSSALAAPPLVFGNTIYIKATNAPDIVFTIRLSGSANIHPRANQIVVNFRTALIAHFRRLDNSPFYFKIHLELLDQKNEVIHVISFNTSEKPNEDTMSFHIPEDVAKEVTKIRSAFHAV